MPSRAEFKRVDPSLIEAGRHRLEPYSERPFDEHWSGLTEITEAWCSRDDSLLYFCLSLREPSTWRPPGAAAAGVNGCLKNVLEPLIGDLQDIRGKDGAKYGGDPASRSRREREPCP
jgi:hypothetical protein